MAGDAPEIGVRKGVKAAPDGALEVSKKAADTLEEETGKESKITTTY